MAKLQAIRGMHDILMSDTPRWEYLEHNLKAVMSQYAYQQIRMPIVEKTELFARSIGDNTDIVSKEMYTFNDRNEDSLTLRPEGTAGTVRAGIEHGFFYNQVQRLWYLGPMFRHERPQKGRQRQFHQFGVEAFGMSGPDIDAELILICDRIWKRLGIIQPRLEINTLGTPESRRVYREKLVEYFSDYRSELDEDSLVRLEHNPLRILDSKNPAMKEIIKAAPLMTEYLDQESADHFAGLKVILDARKVSYEVNTHLVRGLDYYTRTVFEWVTDQLGAQGTICAGGRYDGLVEQHGGNPTPAVGFAIGLERLIELLPEDTINNNASPQVYFIVATDRGMSKAQNLAESLRDEIQDIRVMLHCGGGSMKNQFKKADKSGAELALVLGDEELEKQELTIKSLRSDTPQTTVTWSDVAKMVSERLKTT